MNWIEILNLVISIFAIGVSVYSIYLTDQNRQKQQNLEKEMQDNEFRFSRRKVWYDKQNIIIDTTLEKITEINGNLLRIRMLVRKQTDQDGNLSEIDQERLRNYLHTIDNHIDYISAKKHYFPKKFDKNIESIIDSTNFLFTELGGNTKFNEDEVKLQLINISVETEFLIEEIRNKFIERE